VNRKLRWLIGIGIAAIAGVASAAETITYTYDARGRLVQVQRAGTVNDGLQTSYTIDKADNRTNKTTVVVPPPPPSFAVFNASGIEGATLQFTVTKSGVAVGSLSVNYATANGNAVSGTDYVATSGTLTFAQSETSKTVTVSTINNTSPELDEQFSLNLSGATGGATITDGSGVGTITDNDIGGGGGGSDCHTEPSGEIVCQ
jgi:YD repeat-containing protein